MEAAAAPSAYSAAQRAYAGARKRVSRVGVDHLLMERLADGVLWSELDALGASELAVIRELLRCCRDGEALRGVHLGYGLGASRRRAACILDPKEALLLTKALRRGRITVLELAGLELAPAACAELGRALAEAPVRLVSLAGTRLGDKGMAKLAPGLEACEAQDVLLRGCGLTDGSAGPVCAIVRAHADRRRDLLWSVSLRGSSPQLEEAEDVAMRGVLALDLSENALGDEMAKGLAWAVAADEWLGAVNLARNRVGSDGMEALEDALESNDALAVLDLRHNLAECAEVDAALRARSIQPDHGLLARRLPHAEAHAEGSVDELMPQLGARDDELLAAQPEAAVVVAQAILRWGSGHQLDPAIRSVVASLGSGRPAVQLMEAEAGAVATAATAFPATKTTPLGPRLSPTSPSFASRQAADTPPRTKSSQREAAQRKQPRRKDSKGKQPQLVVVPSPEPRHPGAAVPGKRRSTRKKKRSMSSSVSRSRRSERDDSRVNGGDSAKSASAASSAAVQTKMLATAFAEEVNRAIAEYAAQLEPTVAEVVLDKCKAPGAPDEASLDMLERSVQQLNEVLDQLSMSTPQASPEPSPRRASAPRSPASDLGLADEITGKVADRLAELWPDDGDAQD